MSAIQELSATIERDVRIAAELVASAQAASGRDLASLLGPDFDPVANFRRRSRRQSSVESLRVDRDTDLFGGEDGLALPVRGRISSRFGMRHHPVHGDHRHHAGLDIAAPTGTPVHAMAAGRVVFAGSRGGYGSTVELRHANGTVTRYAHLSEISVEAGEDVGRFHAIGLVGATGTATGPHLHLEVIDATGERLDPELHLGGHRR